MGKVVEGIGRGLVSIHLDSHLSFIQMLYRDILSEVYHYVTDV
jgi:hypothetical protein